MRTITFDNKIVAGGPDDLDGIFWSANSIGLNSGTIKLAAKGVPLYAVLDHPAQGPLATHTVDLTVPVLSSASAAAGTVLLLTYDDDLDNASTPAASDSSVTVGKEEAAAPDAVSISGPTVVLTVGSAMSVDDTATVLYTKPASNPIKNMVNLGGCRLHLRGGYD